MEIPSLWPARLRSQALRGAWQPPRPGPAFSLRGAGRELPLQIWAAWGTRAYLPPHPALSLTDSFLCSYALLILSPRFCPDPAEESGKRDPLPHMRDFLHRVGLSEPPRRLSPAQKASTCLCRSGGPRVRRLWGRWNSFDKQKSI